MARTATRTPAKKSSRSKSPPATRSRVKKKAEPTKKSASKSPAPTPKKKTTPKKKATPAKKLDMSIGSVTDDETDTEVETMTVVADKPESKTALRVVFYVLYLVAAGLMFKTELVLTKLGNESKEELLTQALAVALFALAMQHTAAVQMPHASRKRSLQYGMVTWLSFAALAVHAQSTLKDFQFMPFLVLVNLAFVFISLLVCYYV